MAVDWMSTLRRTVAGLRCIVAGYRHPQRLLLRVERLREGRLDRRRLAAREYGRTIAPQDWERLSERERAVAREFARGRTYREISAALGINNTAVRNALRSVRGITGIRHRWRLTDAITAYVELHPEPEALPSDRLWIFDLLCYVRCADSNGVAVLPLEHGLMG